MCYRNEQFTLGQVLSQLPAMIITVEFIWRIYDLKSLFFRRLTYASMVLFNIGTLVTFLPAHPLGIVPLARAFFPVCLQAFDALTLGASLWMLFVKKRYRVIAAAMSFVPISSLLYGFVDSIHGGVNSI